MAVSVQPWRVYGEKVYQQYLQAQAYALDLLLAQGTIAKAAIVLMSASAVAEEEDLDAAQELVSRMKMRDSVAIIREDLTSPDICALFREARFLLGTRTTP